MLTETDPRVLAHVNLFAVLGSLTVLGEVAPEARDLLARIDKPTTVVFRVRGLPERALTFSGDGIVDGTGGARTVILGFVSPGHLNSLVEGTAQPIPVASPAGLGFLTRVFAPLAEVLGRYLKPSPDDLADPEFLTASTLLTLHVAIAAVAQVANTDRSGMFSAALIPDGQIGVAVGGGPELRLHVADHHLTFDPRPNDQPARATLSFRDLTVAGDLLAGRTSALACICDGSMGMRGFIPMIDNLSRILDRVGHYLGD